MWPNEHKFSFLLLVALLLFISACSPPDQIFNPLELWG